MVPQVRMTFYPMSRRLERSGFIGRISNLIGGGIFHEIAVKQLGGEIVILVF